MFSHAFCLMQPCYRKIVKQPFLTKKYGTSLSDRGSLCDLGCLNNNNNNNNYNLFNSQSH